MNIEYYYKKIDPLGDASRKYIEEKLKAVEKLEKMRDARVEVTQRKDGDFYLNVSMRSVHGAEYRAEQKHADVNAAIDIIEEEIKKQVRRNKEKMRDLSRKGGRLIKDKIRKGEL